jgi:acyl-CoA thioesterase-1
MLSRLFLVFMLALLPAAASARTILVFGDSLSAGYGLPQDQGWVRLLEKRLQNEKGAYSVANASLSGETTSGGASRIAGALKAHRPDIVIVELGANDGLRGQSLDVMRKNLETIVDASRRANAEVVLVGMRLPPNYGPAYTEKFQRTFADIARAKKLTYVPFLLEGFAEDAAFFQPDRVHPTVRAQSLIVETVWKELKPLLKR